MKGILLINLGSPASTQVEDIASYLREFLLDPYVIPLWYPLRWFLVNCLIIPKRKITASHAYQSIWRKEGSPLVYYSEELSRNLQVELEEVNRGKYAVHLGMRYGNPSIEGALLEFVEKGIQDILVVPLYPQYAESSTETAAQEVKRVIADKRLPLSVQFQEEFFQHPLYIDALAVQIKKGIEEFKPEKIVFSYHGLPIQAVKKLCREPISCYNEALPCSAISEKNIKCYRAQCFATTETIAAALKLEREKYITSFQSRLTHRWIQPFSDLIFQELARENVARVLVICPSFIADCLETLEEIQIRARKEYKSLCGGDLRLLPALNSEQQWVKVLASIIVVKD